MTESVLSKRGIPVRLTDERWTHITEEHCELAGMRLEILEAVSEPDWIFEGNGGVLLAVRKCIEKFIVVVYREQETEGFIITSFITTRRKYFERRRQIWPA